MKNNNKKKSTTIHRNDLVRLAFTIIEIVYYTDDKAQLKILLFWFRLFVRFNDNRSQSDIDECVVEMFEAHVRTPDSTVI